MLLLVAGMGCSSGVNFAGLKTGPRSASFQDHIVATRLDNGLRVAVLPDTRTNLVTVTVRYEVGGADDPADAGGLAHYVEHLLGEKPVPVDAGLAGNAMTSFDRTYFYSTALDTQLDSLLEAAAGRFELSCNSFDDAMLARERDVVIEELKLRSRYGWAIAAVAPAIWGSGHPYARPVGGAAFVSIPRQRLCEFIDQHYGPGVATLVVTGNVDARVLDRIRARFSRIPSRPIAKRDQLPAIQRDVVQTGVRGLKSPTVALVFAVPGEGGSADAAADILDGMDWRLGRDSPTRVARTLVVGEERQRVVIAVAAVDDPAKLHALAAALEHTFSRPTVGWLAGFQRTARSKLVRQLDDLPSAGIQIADLVARGAPLSRFRQLRAIDDLKPEDVARVFGAPDRVLELLPEGDSTEHEVAEIATALHHVDLPSESDASDLAPPPVPGRRISSAVFEDKLTNGLTVWLAPDPQAVAIDARVVMPFHVEPGKERELADEVAWFLDPPTLNHDDAARVRWYRSIAVPVSADIEDRATTFDVAGLALFGDWHVWELAFKLIHGTYPAELDRVRDLGIRSSEPPSPLQVVERRLAGERAPRGLTVYGRDELEAYRRAHYDPSAATLIVAGHFDLESMRREIRTLFSEWHPVRTRARETSAPVTAAPGFVAIPVLHATTLDLAVGFPPQSLRSPQEDAARSVLSEIINDKLRVIREGLGISYGVYAQVGRSVLVGGSVEPAYAADAVHALLDAIRELHDGDPAFTAAFISARKRVLARALAEPAGPTARASELERAVLAGRGLAELDQELEAIRTVDLAEVKKIAARDLRIDQMIVAVRGEPDAIKAALAAFGATSFDTATR